MGKMVRPGQTVRDLVIKDLNDNVSTSQAKNVRHVRQSNVSLQVTFNPTWAIVDKLDEAQRLLREHQAKCKRMGISLRPSKDGEREGAVRDDHAEDGEEEEDTHTAKENFRRKKANEKVIDAKLAKIHEEERAQKKEVKLRKMIKEIRQVRTQRLTNF